MRFPSAHSPCSDLISSADTIIDIARSCRRLVDLTEGLQSGLGELAAGAADAGAAASSTTPGAVSSYDRLYALGSRIKYLIDTPETIYGCLDAREHLAAARRYVRAAEVHAVLTAGQVKQVAQRFPLLQHQWPLVKKFRAQVHSAAGAWLASHGELNAREAAATLAAQALLKPMDGAEVRHGRAWSAAAMISVGTCRLDARFVGCKASTPVGGSASAGVSSAHASAWLLCRCLRPSSRRGRPTSCSACRPPRALALTPT